MAPIVCPNCGLSNIPERKTCKNCGGSLRSNEVELPPIRVQTPAVSQNSLIGKARVCPKCERADAIQKVTSIISSGTSTGTIDTWDPKRSFFDQPTSTVTVVTNLAEKLQRGAPTTERAKPLSPNTTFGCSLALLSVSVIIPLMLTINGLSDKSAMTSPGWIIIGPVLLTCIVWAIISSIKGRSNLQQQYHEKQYQYEQAIAQDKRARERWEQLYYCHRDSCVFVPGEIQSASVEQINSILYI